MLKAVSVSCNHIIVVIIQGVNLLQGVLVGLVEPEAWHRIPGTHPRRLVMLGYKMLVETRVVGSVRKSWGEKARAREKGIEKG
jgi:hypothetical protein